MNTPNRSFNTQECDAVLEAGNPGGANLDGYLLHSKQELHAIGKSFARNAAITAASRDWMLAQADYIVETVGDDRVEMSDQMRSDLLQLLLAIADLNEQVRSRAASVASASRA